MVSAKEWKFDEIFRRNNRFTFEIPKYQRGYSWENQNIEDFWEDLVSTNDKEDHNHFFGAIYTSTGNESNQIRIVDGQQRITTAALFLICARDYFYTLKDSVEEANKYLERMNEILFRWDSQTHKPDLRRFYLTLSRTNKDYFLTQLIPTKKLDEKSKIKEIADNDSNEFLADAYLKLSKLISTKYCGSDIESVEGLNKLVWTLLDKFELIRVEVNNDDQAYEMFNLINNRGLQLADSDLIKNKLFGKLDKEFGHYPESEDMLDEYDEKWLQIKNNITGKTTADYNIDNFFHHYLIAFEFDTLKLKEIFGKFTELLEKKKPDVIIEDLVTWSKVFVKLRNPKNHFDRISAAEHYLTKIADINAIYVYPVLLSGYKNYWENGDKKSFATLAEICLKYHIRTKSVGIGITLESYQTKLHKIAHMIATQSATINQVIDELMKDDNAYPSDEKILPQLKTLKMVNSNLSRVILEEMERVYDREKFSGPDVSVEHIMPKSTKYWIDYIIKENKYSDKTGVIEAKAMHAKYCNWLGNQTLISDSKNKKISNKSFEEKKKIYAEEGYKITTQLKNEDKWTEERIIARQNVFVDNLLNILDLSKYKN